MSITDFLARIGERYSDAGGLNLVHRGNVAYYLDKADSCLCLYNGKLVNIILTSVSCDWMYIDKNQNLWFGMKGSFGISGGEVREWNRVYRYDRANDSFALKLEESASLKIYGGGYAAPVYKNYILYYEDGNLKAYNTLTDKAAVVGEADEVCFDESQNLFYYGSPDAYTLITNFGEKNQLETKLSRKNFPGKQLDCSKYILDDEGLLFEFERTGYKMLYQLSYPASYQNSDPTAPCSSMITDDGLVVLCTDKVYADVYNIKNKTWSSMGDPDKEGRFVDFIGGGRLLFTGVNENKLYIIGQGFYREYDLSDSMTAITWASYVNGAVLMCNTEEGAFATHIFLPDTQELFTIDYCIPGVSATK